MTPNRTHPPRHRAGEGRSGRGRARAMTLVEAVVAVLIVGVMLAASIATVGASRKALKAGSDRGQGLELAHDLMDEILAQPYDDPSGSSAIPSTGNRSQFDNVGDYAGWSETPPDDKSGTPLPGFAGWTRSVAIRYVQAGNIALGNATDTGISEVTVRVLRGSNEVARLTGIRTRGPATQACKFGNGTCADLTTADCAARGGTSQGAGTSCYTLVVPDPVIPRVGLVAQWAMDDASGTKAKDSAGSNDAALKNGPTWGTGRFGGALVLDGVNDYATAPDAPSLSQNNTFTVAAWMYFEAVPGANQWQVALFKGSTTYTPKDWNYALACTNGKVDFEFINTLGLNEAFVGGSITTIRTWYHLAATYDHPNSTVKLYLNGALVSTALTLGMPKVDTKAVWLGADPYGADYTRGRIDDVRLYRRVLSPAEVATLYNGGEP